MPTSLDSQMCQSPEYQSRVEMLPAYRESLHTRYPPVCESCLPQVEEEMRQKEQMARAKALGGWLSKGKERRQRRVSGPNVEKERISPKEVYWWRIRGCLFAASYAISMASSLAGEYFLCCQIYVLTLSRALFPAVYGYYPFGWSSFLYPILPVIVGISLLWTVWDPTYLSFRKAEIQGRDVRIHGKRTYNVSFLQVRVLSLCLCFFYLFLQMVQMLTWATRMISSIILSVRWFRPDLNILQLDGPRAIYLLAVFSVEIIVSPSHQPSSSFH